ncbi:hypothetical protein [Janthinobacterium sp. GMG1]|uniref:hypothetical protein n=1 Tax=Janthinobacterium sp. GMG1 TaxID=3096007 RepID=UPI002ACA0DB9|nr:hypothetical protein [Janthinobacterium sp. GMG1]MDZ5633910.1 hypothetical protein [Janthinobacterium sp. GMG1]
MKKESMVKEELIDKLLKIDGSMELYKLLMGISDFNRERDNVDYSLGEAKLISAARNHLSFVAKFGNKESHVIVGEKHYFSYPDKFNEWIQAGAPGIFIEELELCLSTKSSSIGR